MKVLVVAEYYPRAGDPVRGVWSHHQALAAREAGADLRVMVLHRPLPPLRALRSADRVAIATALRQPGRAELDGLVVDYLRYLSPPRPWSYSSWGAWAAPMLSRKLRAVRRRFPFDLIHAHYAVPAGDAVRRAAPAAPLVVSVHGHDVYGRLAERGSVRATLGHARLVLANSAGTAVRSAERGALHTRVVHLGADVPAAARTPPSVPTLVSVGHLVARKRHTDVIDALALLRVRHPELRYVIVGDGPERGRLRAQAAALGLERQVELRGQLPHPEAVAAAQSGSLFVLPSVDEAFGVAYVEAMAAGVPAIGCLGEDGPAEIAAAGEGIVLVPPSEVPALAEQIDRVLNDPARLEAMGAKARMTVQREFTWEKCGLETIAAYREVLAGGRS